MSKTTSQQQEIYQFPNLSVAIKIGRSGGSIESIDLQLPDDLFSCRIDEWRWPILGEDGYSEVLRSEHRHKIANCLHIASMALELVQSKVEDGEHDLQPLLSMALESLAELEPLSARPGTSR